MRRNVDYIGILKDLKNALDIYGLDSDKRIKYGEYSVQNKEELIKLLQIFIGLLVISL